MYDQKFNYNAMVPVAVSEVKKVHCQEKTSNGRKVVLGGGIYIHTAVHVAVARSVISHYALLLRTTSAIKLLTYSHIILNEEYRDCILLYVWQYACL